MNTVAADSSADPSCGAMPVKTLVYDGTPVRLCVDSARQIWIVGSDLEKPLGLQRPRKFFQLLDEIDKLTQSIPTAKGNQEAVLISMWGYQQLSTKTRNKGSARAFSHWLLEAIGNCLALHSSQTAQNRSTNHSWRSNSIGSERSFGTSPLGMNPFHCKEPWDGVSTLDPALSFRPEPGSSWEKVALILKENLGDAVFRSWVAKLSFDFVKGDTVVLRVANGFLRDTIKERYTYHLLKAWQAVESWIQEVDVRVARSY